MTDTTTPTETKPPLFEKIPGKIPNGIFTVSSSKGHRTFRVKTVNNEDSPLHGRRIVYMLTGNDNLFDYTGIAFLNTDENGNDSIKVWKRHEGTAFHKAIIAFLHVIGSEAAPGDNHTFGTPDPGWEAYKCEESRECMVCNRTLTNPESIESGIGPVCAGRGGSYDGEKE